MNLSPRLIILVALFLTIALLGIIYFSTPNGMPSVRLAKKQQKSPFMTTNASPNRNTHSKANEIFEKVQNIKGNQLKFPEIKLPVEAVDIPPRPANLQ